MKKQYFYSVAVAAIVASAPAFAQETTSAIRGTVESNGAPIVGADVSLTHVPSGTVANATTGTDGSFSANGLRIGGPYNVTIKADGYEDSQVTDIFLTAGQPLRLPVNIERTSEIIVTAAKSNALEVSTGPITALDREDIEGAASINRDIRDLARRDPFTTIDLTNSRTIEIAGTNGRLNRFSVDGVQFSDDFGLNNGGLPTARGPVPYDAIEQFSVKVAPFDVSEGDFQGGAINVILRSGANKFKGSAFYTYTDEKLSGDKTRGVPVALDFSSKQYGGILSGPIIKDKLFFMVAYEKADESKPFDSGPQGQGFAAPIPNLSATQVDLISQIAKTNYNYDTLGVIRNAIESDEKYVVKLDWNVTDDHRASVTYIRNVGTVGNQRNTFTTVATPQLGLFSTGYELSEEVNSGVFQLNSSWSDSFSTEVRASYRDYNRGQTPFGARTLGEITVCVDPVSVGSLTSCASGQPSVTFGPDVARHSNKLNTENLSIDFTAKLDAGAHSLKAVAGYTDTSVFNLFVQRTLGEYYFDSIADFQAGRAGQLRYGNAVPSLDPNDGAASFSAQTWTFGLQDDWQINDALQVTIGARYDLFGSADTPILNPNFLARQGFSNRHTFNGKGVLQPRVGFNWKANDRLIVRGGFGVFAGGSPDVFLANSFSNTGQLTNEIRIRRNTSANGCDVATTVPNAAALCAAALNNVTLSSIPGAVTGFLTTNTASLAASPVNAIDPDLKIARQFRATLSVDYDADLGPLGENWLFGANLLYGNTMQGYTWTDIRSRQSGTLPDGRPRYVGLIAGDSNQDLLMTNSKLGRSYVGVVRLAKSWDFGLSIDGSYTRSNVKDENAITSTTASSLYNNNVFFDSNRAAYGRSIYEIKDQWKFNIDFKTELFGDNETRLGIFGEYRSGRPYSLAALDRTTGRLAVLGTVGNGGRGLLYVPTLNDPRVSFNTTASETAFNALIAANGLEKFRGKILPKNSLTSPDFFKIDLHVSQELPLFVGSAKVKLFADVENVLNMIDSDWGALRQVNFPYAATVADVQCLSVPVPTGTVPGAGVVNTASTQTCAQYRYSAVTSPDVVLRGRESLYGIRVGVKISF
ncbi:MAG: TonB-dependent receptor [Chakrabartia sp.]